MRKGQEWLTWVAVIVALAMGGISARAQAGIGILHSFTNSTTDGSDPKGTPLLIGPMLYGVTYNGGSSFNGTVFQISTNGTGFGLVYSFQGGANGANPYCSLVSTGSSLYGMTFNGGVNDGGIVYGVNTNGTGFSVLHTFLGGSSDGLFPFGSLSINGTNLYGMTANGGTNDAGVVFKMNTDGSGFGVVHSFAGGIGDGSFPNEGVVLGGTTLYGTTFNGGSNDLGIVFAMDTAAVSNGFKILHHFAGEPNDGANATGPLTLNGSTLYGITTYGGITNFGVVFNVSTNGASFAVLHHFQGGTNDGALPQFGPLVVTNSVIYGATEYGGPLNRGVLFQMNADGTGFAVVHSFSTNVNDGAFPSWGPILSGSFLYGVTVNGGSNDLGVVYGAPATNTQTQSMCTNVDSTLPGGVPIGNVIAGQAYLCTASGCVQLSATAWDDPDGNEYKNSFCTGATHNFVADYSFPCPGYIAHQLVGEVGGTCIGLGSSSAFVAPASGTLTLYCNDNGYGDNDGSWYVCITPLTCTTITTPTLTQVSEIYAVVSNVIIKVPTVLCESYQLQYSDEMVPTNWINTGAAQLGSGSPIQFIAPTVDACSPPAACMVAPPGLVGWWPGDENAVDVVGRNNGVLSNGATYAVGEVCQAFSFGGTSYVQVPHRPLWDFGTNDFTIELWANFSSTNGQQALISCDDGGGGSNKWVLFHGYQGTNGFTFHLNGPAFGGVGQQIGGFQRPFAAGQWCHIAMTRGGSTWSFYVNGSLAGSAWYAAPMTVPTMTAPLIIGSAEGSFYFNGLEDEVSIYNRALTAGEIQNIWSAGVAGKCKPPLTHRFYRVDEFP